MSDHIHHLEQHSIHLIREAYARLKPLAMLWSLGKDSNTLLWLVRKAFQGRVPFPVILLDTGNEFAEVYAFRDRYVREWNLDYINAPCPAVETTDPALPPKARAAARKTLGLKQLIAERGFAGILLGIRRDEQPIRGKERGMSPRDAQGGWHVREQPTELWGHYASAGAAGRSRARASAARMDRARRLALCRARSHSRLRALLRARRHALPFARRGRHYVPGAFAGGLAGRDHPRTRDDEDRGTRRPRDGPRARGCVRAPARRGLHVMGRPLAVCLAGHVDHGKSSLLGRLLHELDLLPEGKVAKLEAASASRGVPLEWSFALDALQLERDQAVTLDTTRVHVRTPKRELIVIDCPGHRELVRNLVTGAAGTSAALLVVDAQAGAEAQTRAHAALLRLLGIQNFVVAVNKMDALGWSEARFNARRDEIAQALAQLGVVVHAIVPTSARDGGNIAAPPRQPGGADRRW